MIIMQTNVRFNRISRFYTFYIYNVSRIYYSIVKLFALREKYSTN